MSMTKQHFEQIARETRSQVNAYRTADKIGGPYTAEIEALKTLMVALCDVFLAANERFDRKRFLTACGF